MQLIPLNPKVVLTVPAPQQEKPAAKQVRVVPVRVHLTLPVDPESICPQCWGKGIPCLGHDNGH